MADKGYVICYLRNPKTYSTIAYVEASPIARPVTRKEAEGGRFDIRDIVYDFDIRKLDRYTDLSYEEILDEVYLVCDMEEIVYLSKDVLIDISETGDGVLSLSMGRLPEPIGVVVTQEREERFEDIYYIPRRELVNAMVVGVQTGHVKPADELPMRPVFDNQLANFEYAPQRRDDIQVEEDMVMAAAIGVWNAGEDHVHHRAMADRFDHEKGTKDRTDWDPLDMGGDDA
tara:strand:+ start:1176 stop:1862 length:687 start_codon:yes stop_codon:yes gene_type:complete